MCVALVVSQRHTRNHTVTVVDIELVSTQSLDKFERLKDIHVWRTANGLPDDGQVTDESRDDQGQDTSIDSASEGK